jgi:hypothetical protein
VLTDKSVSKNDGACISRVQQLKIVALLLELLDPEDASMVILPTFHEPPLDTVSHPKRPETTTTLL